MVAIMWLLASQSSTETLASLQKSSQPRSEGVLHRVIVDKTAFKQVCDGLYGLCTRCYLNARMTASLCFPAALFLRTLMLSTTPNRLHSVFSISW